MAKKQTSKAGTADGLAKKFMEIFAGMEEAHGTYEIRGPARMDGKRTGQARTIREPVSVALWSEHLAGTNSIGIVPIRTDETCSWGCIDVDVYPVDHKEVLRRIKDAGLPMCVTVSKSGGAHAFLFLEKPTPAAELQPVLHDIAAQLGYGTSEVFPKQIKVLYERGDIGNWLNMPYFGNSRLGLDEAGNELTPEEFIEFAFGRRTSLEKLHVNGKEGKKSKKAEPDWAKIEPLLKDGPPCLQHLALISIPEGARNLGLFAFGVFARKAYPDDWKARLEEYNRKFTGGKPISTKEMATLMKSLERKDYHYRCKDAPINAHCNSGLCRTKRFGIKGDDGMPIFSGLTKLNTDQPLWFLDIEGGGRLELETKELQEQKAFQLKCMKTLTVVPVRMKEDQWQTLLNELMKNVVIVEAPPDVSLEGQFEDLLSAFCTDRAQAQTRDEILLGKPWTDAGRTYFRMADLEHYLVRNRFVVWTRTQIMNKLRKMNGDSHFFNLKGHGVRVWWVPEFWKQTEAFETPEMPKEPF